MRRYLRLPFVLAGLWGLVLAGVARADDTDLLNRFTAPPNVLIILDTSQSMSWYNYLGASRGEEYPGWTGDNTPAARMAMAKSVLSTVVDTYFSLLRLGLASYAEGGTGTPPNVNPNANVRIRRYFYYCGNTGAYCTNAAVPNPPRAYPSLVPTGTSVSNPTTDAEWNNLQLWTDSSSINMPLQNTFSVNWDLDTVGQNPTMTTIPGLPYSDPPAVTRCRFQVQEWQYDNLGNLKPGYPHTYGYNSPTAACPGAGTTGTLTQTEAFVQRLSQDTPNPYQYRRDRSWSGYQVPGQPGPGFVGNPVYNQLQPLNSWTNYVMTFTYNGGTWIDDPPPSGGGPDTYTFTFKYKGTCTSGCSGFLTTTRTTAPQASQTPPPSPLAVPFPRTYTWLGNRYELKTADTSCPGGGGISMMVDVGGAPDANALKNFLGTGTDKTKELHGANVYTPLATSLDSTRQYFLTSPLIQDIAVDPQKDCRKNYVILITDGGESCPLVLTVPVTAPTAVGNKAGALLNASINPAMIPTGATTFVVGLDAGNFFPDEVTVLGDMAAQGHDPDPNWPCKTTIGGSTYDFCSASSTAGLLAALNRIIGIILSDQYSFVNPVVPTLRTQDNLMLVQGSFKTPAPTDDPNTPLWKGYLEAFPLGNTGTLPITGLKITAPPLWEARAVLGTTLDSTRNVTTVVDVGGGTLVQTPFKTTSAQIAAIRTALNVTTDLNGDTFVTTADADWVICTARTGSGCSALGAKGFLGDIFHSVPAIVGPPSPTFVDRTFDPANPTQLLGLGVAPDTFAAFRNAQNTRQRLAIVGTNAGVLHAFDAGTYDSILLKYNTGTGAEKWAFVPPQFLPRLQYLAMNNGHQYFNDASPRVADVWLDLNSDGVKDPTGGEWYTYLISGFRQGGTGLYALDITNTLNPVFKWTYATTGESWSEPVIGKVKVQVAGRLVDRWVAIVGDGYDSSGTNGRMVHIIDIQTGKPLWQYTITTALTSNPAPVAGSPLALDLDNDGYLDRVYVGTMGGDVLRLDISAVGQNSGGNVDPANGVMVDNWSIRVFFSAGPAQPFFTKGAASMDPKGNLWFFIGSGDRNNPLAIPGTDNRIYGIKDPYPGNTATLTETDLSNMTLNNTLDASAVTGQGWFVVLRPGEKEWAETALVFNSQVFFTTFIPQVTTCGDVGSGTIYMVYYLTGGGVTDTALFQANPPQVSSRIFQVNDGSTSRPVVTTGTLGANAVVYLSNMKMLTLTPTFSVPSSIRATRYWRRIM